MADEPLQSAPPATGAEGTPEPTAVLSPAEAPAATPEVVAEVAAPVEPAAPAVEPIPEPEPTLLQKFDAEKAAKEPAAVEPKPAEAKPAEPAAAEAKPAEAPKPEAEKPAEPAAPAAIEPVAYEYALPETLTMDDGTKGKFHSALDAFRTDPTKGAQGLIDLHNENLQQYADHVAREQYRVFGETRKGWQRDVMADEELGGAGYETSMGAVARMRDLLVPESRRDAFNQMLTVTGVGDHPEFLRILHNAARLYDEAPMPQPGARPTPDAGKPQGRGLRSLYKTNPGQ